MAAPSYTYTLTNGTTADASQVMQNFNDILNGATDGTKDLTVSALTVQGNFTVNGTTTTIGNGSSDSLVVTASLGSHVVPSTTFTYDLGSSSIGLRSLYLGDAGSAARATLLRSATIAAGWTFTFPTAAGTNRFVLKTDGSGNTSWTPQISPEQRMNYSIAASVAGNALTVALKGLDGNDPSSTNPVDIVFRNGTATTGTPVVRQATAATSVVVSSGSTLGFTSATTEYSYVYALDNAGTIELAILGGAQVVDEHTLQTSTTEGGAGGADTRYTLYSTTGRSGVPCRLLARLKHSLTTAGTWDEVPDEIALVVNAPYDDHSEIVLDTTNAYGSVATSTLRWTNTQTSRGSAITYNAASDEATNGGSLTINREGVYSIDLCVNFSAGNRDFGITKNVAAADATAITGLTLAEVLIISRSESQTNSSGACSVTTRLKPGDVIHAKTDAGTQGTGNAQARFRITKVA